MKKRTYYLATILIIILAIFLRLWQLGKVPVATYWDETAILLDSWSVAQTGHDWYGHSAFQRIFASYGDFKLPVYLWFSSLSVKLFGVSAWAMRLPSAIAGIFSVLLSALLAKDLWLLFVVKKKENDNEKRAEQISKKELSNLRLLQVSTLLVSATSYWGIHFSHVGFEGHLGQLFLSLTIWALLQTLLYGRSFTKKHAYIHNWVWLAVGALSAGLAVFTYYSVRFVLPGVVVGLAILFWWKNRDQLHHIKIILRTALVSIISLAVVALSVMVFSQSPLFAASQKLRLSTPSVLNSTRHIEVANKIQIIQHRSLLSRILYHREIFRAQFLLENMLQHFSPDFLYLTGDSNLRHGTGEHGLLSIIFLPILLIGIWKLSQKSTPLLLFLFGWWILATLPASVPYEVPHALRSLNAFQPIMILHGIGLYFLWQWLATLGKNFGSNWDRWGRLISLLSVVMIVASSLLYLYHYQTQYALDSKDAWQAGYQQMADFVKSQQPFYMRIWAIPPDGRWFLWLLLAQDQSPTLLPEIDRGTYSINSVANVVVDKPACKDIHFANQLLVGRQSAVDAILEQCDLTANVYQIVNSPMQEPVAAASGKL